MAAPSGRPGWDWTAPVPTGRRRAERDGRGHNGTGRTADSGHRPDDKTNRTVGPYGGTPVDTAVVKFTVYDMVLDGGHRKLNVVVSS